MVGHLARRDVLELLGWLAGPGVEVETADTDDSGQQRTAGSLQRFATSAHGAEITGLHVTGEGEVFFNVQHPSVFNDDPYDWGLVGAVEGVNVHELDTFESVSVPDGQATERVQTAKGSYRILGQGAEDIGDGRLGVPETEDSLPTRVGYMPAFNGFVPDGDGGYLFTNWESRPGTVSRIELRREDGGWTVVEKENVDFRDVKGTWRNCYGTLTPWETPLTSEEWHPEAKSWAEDIFELGRFAMDRYLEGDPNPYRYGYIVEIEDPKGDPTPVKHFGMGRFSHENAVVMPDRKTAYLSDDGTGTVLFKFVADEAGDLTSGTLYAAKADPDPGADPGEVGFDVEWIELAHGENDQIESWIAEYDDGDSYISQSEVDAWARGDADDDRVAFLESRRAAAAAGATAEFRKMEGINVRPGAAPGDYVYVSMAEINETMADDQGDLQLNKNDYGAVYRMQLDGNYDVSRMEPVLVGGPEGNVCGGCPYDADPRKDGEPCESCQYNPIDDPENEDGDGLKILGPTTSTTSGGSEIEKTVTNPDNLEVLPDGRLLVGEDTGYHQNNMIWLFDPESA